LEKLEEMFKERVSRVLNQLGVPTYSDIQNLSKQVELLDKSIKELTAARKKVSTGKRATRA
jgi:poly(hydroxyalkanoate) granule-associated protein